MTWEFAFFGYARQLPRHLRFLYLLDIPPPGAWKGTIQSGKVESGDSHQETLTNLDNGCVRKWSGFAQSTLWNVVNSHDSTPSPHTSLGCSVSRPANSHQEWVQVMLASLSGAVLATRQEQPQQQLLKACLHPGPRNHLAPRVYRAQMNRDFAADLAEVFWHMTWDLCIDFAMFLFKHMTWEFAFFGYVRQLPRHLRVLYLLDIPPPGEWKGTIQSGKEWKGTIQSGKVESGDSHQETLTNLDNGCVRKWSGFAQSTLWNVVNSHDSTPSPHRTLPEKSAKKGSKEPQLRCKMWRQALPLAIWKQLSVWWFWYQTLHPFHRCPPGSIRWATCKPWSCFGIRSWNLRDRSWNEMLLTPSLGSSLSRPANSHQEWVQVMLAPQWQSGAVLVTRQEQLQQQLLKACLHPGPRNHLAPRVYRAQMNRDFAADLAEVFWHMTWDLCIDFAMFLFKTWHGSYART